jgi:hypothetical protein
MMHINEEGEQPYVHRHSVDYTDHENKVVIEESTSKENVDGSVIKLKT